jgi:hypothetical protein
MEMLQITEQLMVLLSISEETIRKKYSHIKEILNSGNQLLCLIELQTKLKCDKIVDDLDPAFTPNHLIKIVEKIATFTSTHRYNLSTATEIVLFQSFKSKDCDFRRRINTH